MEFITKFRSYMEKLEAEHGVLLNCNDEGKDRRRKIHYVLFSIGQQGRDVFNTMTWKKKKNAKGNATDKVNITVRQLIKNFEDYFLPKKNLVAERREYFWKNQNDDETFDQYMA